MRYFELCEKSVGFANEIMESDEFKELLSIKEEIFKKIPKLLDEFKKAKEKYEEISIYSTYHPDYKKVKLELVRTKEALYTNELVIKYKELERKIQEKLNAASQEIVKAISNNVK
jgi:cell fate (sporulation/competence/biofilm development) regulator YlbF (YheA/YmcA/DUF963 family)